MGKPDEWGAVGLLLALEGQNFRESPKGEVRRILILRTRVNKEPLTVANAAWPAPESVPPRETIKAGTRHRSSARAVTVRFGAKAARLRFLQ